MFLPADYIFEDLTDSATNDEIIDIALFHLHGHIGPGYIFENTPVFMDDERIVQVVSLMIYHELVTIVGRFGTSNYNLEIKPKGSFIAANGGWLKYLKEKELEEKEAKIASKNTVKSAVRSMQAAWAAVMAAVIIGIIPYILSNKADERIDKLENQVKTLQDSLKIYVNRR